MKTHLIAPSVLSADFANLERDVQMLNRSEADWIHCDIMDGVFVPNLSFGIPVVKAIKKHAFDYLVKGEDNKKIIPLLSKAIEKSKLQSRIHQLEKKVFDKFSFLPRNTEENSYKSTACRSMGI